MISYKDEIYKIRAQKAQERDEEMDRSMTFHPTISQFNLKNKDSSLDVSKWEDLHRQSTHHKQGRRDIPHDEAEFEKEPNEYTFQPNAHKYNTNTSRISAAAN